MKVQYYCKNKGRQQAVRNSTIFNGIDYLEVSADQMTLNVYFIHNLPGPGASNPVPADPNLALTKDNVVIEGGVRVKDVRVESVSSSSNILTLNVNTPGDFSTYTLRLVTSQTDPDPPRGFDPQLSGIEFSFKASCPSEFDCKPAALCPPERLPEPQIDYLAKDYASFRRLMLDRLSVIMPDWKERNPADLGIVLVEVLAYAADHLSYYQDAVATEAYLGTARKRVSVRRHARLLDYPVHDGCNARAWVQVQVSADNVPLKKGTQLLTRLAGHEGRILPDSPAYQQALAQQPEVFETMHDVMLFQAHNEIHFYTWGDKACCLPGGATRATLKNEGNELQHLAAGDVLIFKEVRGPNSGRLEDADPTHSHAVRLTYVQFTTDPLFTEDPAGTQTMRLVEIQWAAEDALPFPLCLWEVEDSAHPGPVSVALGNIVLVDSGRTLSWEELNEIPASGRYRPILKFGPLTQQGHVRDRENQPVLFNPEASASAAMQWKMHDVQPAIKLLEEGNEDNPWLPGRDLLNSSRFAREFVVETEDDGRANLRFGDGVLGRRPTAGTTFKATYRVGNGRAGNVGAEAIFHVVTDRSGIIGALNPRPAQGGVDPEPVEQVRLYAPAAFRTQERAVTEADYAGVARRHPQVQKAMATRRWTGSWYTVFVTVDRKGGKQIDAAFEDDLRAFLERFRLAGYDLEINAPSFVSLDIALTVCVAPGYLRSAVKGALLEIFSSMDMPDGRRGFFHPDNFTFGQPVYLSRLVAAAMQVPGVAWVKPVCFQRWGEEAHGELDEGRITFGRLEIARLDNDPNAPENGRIEFDMRGGL